MSGLSNLFRRSEPVKSGEVTLNRNVNQTVFNNTVNTVLDDNKLTKAEYKSIKDSIAGGNRRNDLNQVMSQTGIASEETLNSVFAKGKNYGEISVTNNQKNQLKTLLGVDIPTNNTISSVPAKRSVINTEDTSNFTENESSKINTMKAKLNYDRNNLSKRYTIDDFICSSEISTPARNAFQNRSAVENYDFLRDQKNILNMTDKSEMKDAMYDLLRKECGGRNQNVNIYATNKNLVDTLLNTPNPSFSQVLTAFEGCNTEIYISARTNSPDTLSTKFLKEAMIQDAEQTRNPREYLQDLKSFFKSDTNKLKAINLALQEYQ